MIEFEHGDLLRAEVEALVNPVNCVGVMGKGLAAQYKCSSRRSSAIPASGDALSNVPSHRQSIVSIKGPAPVPACVGET